ncbi:hypothetical protein FE257_004933 [Aspergillus nanangensis]|uniref:Uncharacterized protein n=1 Tax=Aspergillus nanangensis TaxID=2582783 RepID=A0AAD4CAJ4_ASPNN|nr:hypothetical protein FE257_004933 [Aspergillus nanangensis]
MSCPVPTSQTVPVNGEEISSQPSIYPSPAVSVSTVTRRVTVHNVTSNEKDSATSQAGAPHIKAQATVPTTAEYRTPAILSVTEATGDSSIYPTFSAAPPSGPASTIAGAKASTSADGESSITTVKSLHPLPTITKPLINPDVIFTDSNVTIGLYIVDSINAQPGDSVLFCFYDPYVLYDSELNSPCRAPRLSQNTVLNTGISSYQFAVQSTEPVWFSAGLYNNPDKCNNQTVFTVNPGGDMAIFLENAS